MHQIKHFFLINPKLVQVLFFSCFILFAVYTAIKGELKFFVVSFNGDPPSIAPIANVFQGCERDPLLLKVPLLHPFQSLAPFLSFAASQFFVSSVSILPLSFDILSICFWFSSAVSFPLSRVLPFLSLTWLPSIRCHQLC